MNVILPTSINTTFISSTLTSTGYAFNKQSIGRCPGYTSFNGSATSMIQSFFKSRVTNCLISKPTFSHTNSKVTIQFFYYLPTTKNFSITEAELYSMKQNISGLSNALAQLSQKEVSLIVIRLHYPYLTSSILSQYLAHNAPSNTFLHFQEAILVYPSIYCTSLPAHISGIKVQVSGRLVTERVVPRVTVKSAVVGSFNANVPSTLIDYGQCKMKNELGAFTIKVWICQRKGTV